MHQIPAHSITSMLRTVPLLVIALIFGCGDDDNPSAPGSRNATTATVEIASGSSVPGCEEGSNCYLPYEAVIRPGGEVTWLNSDTSAHTVTSGSAGDGPSGHFDSSLFMAGQSYTTKIETAGTYDYFCMVHPWMTGVVVVE